MARGIADEHSDVELSFLVDDMPPPAQRPQWVRDSGVARWLQRVRATDVVFDEHTTADGSIWATFCINEMWVEGAWQDIPMRDQQLRAILAAEVTDHYLLRFAWITMTAVPLRTTGLLVRWRQALSHYPDLLQKQLIEKSTFAWADPHTVNGPSHWGARHEHSLPFTRGLVEDVHQVLRLLFAINRTWETSWKWIRHDVQDLALKPDRVVERIEEIFSDRDPRQRRQACNLLILDTLSLVPPRHDVSQAIATIQESLRAHSS